MLTFLVGCTHIGRYATEETDAAAAHDLYDPEDASDDAEDDDDDQDDGDDDDDDDDDVMTMMTILIMMMTVQTKQKIYIYIYIYIIYIWIDQVKVPSPSGAPQTVAPHATTTSGTGFPSSQTRRPGRFARSSPSLDTANEQNKRTCWTLILALFFWCVFHKSNAIVSTFRVPRFDISRVPRFQLSGFQGSKAPGLQGFEFFWVQVLYKGLSGLHGSQGSKTPAFRVPSF